MHTLARLKHPLMLLLALSAFGELRGQLPTVDITMVQTMEGPVEVRIRPDGPFDGLLSSIVFTLRWADGEANLGTIQQFVPVNSYCGVNKSGPEHVSNGFRYQVFAGFGFVPLADVPTAWVGGEEIVLCRVNVTNGASVFSIANDAWTNDINNNGDYFISLNGQDRTGEIYTFTTGVDEDERPVAGVALAPNPADRVLTITVTGEQAGPIDIRMTDAAGRIVKSERAVFQSAVPVTMDVSALPAGAYLVHLLSGSGSSSQRVIVQH